MSQILIATHSTLAEGFAQAVRFFKADADNVHFLNGYVASQEFERELREKLEALPAGEPVVVCTDIPGGSVNQVAMKLAGEYGFLLVSGINMPLMLELAFSDDATYESLAATVANAREQLMLPLAQDVKPAPAAPARATAAGKEGKGKPMICLVRADDRLVHGLVAVAWTSHLAPETILVANDAAAADDFKKNALKLAKPAGVKLFVKSVEKAARALNNPINDGKKIFVITQTVEDAWRLYGLLDDAHKFGKLNIGTAGVNKKPGETYVPIIPQVYTTAEEFAAATKLHEAGVTVFGQANPTLEKADFAAIERAMN